MAKDLGTQDPNQKQAVEELKPQCRPYTGNHFADESGGTGYFETQFNVDNQELPRNYPFQHTNATAGEGKWGKFQFEDVDQAGTSASMNGYNEIPYGVGPAYPAGATSVVIVSADRSDRGRES